MITDNLTTFCDKLAVNSGGAGTYNLGKTVDIEDRRDIGQHTQLYLVINVHETFVGGSVSFELASSDSDPLVSPTVHVTTPVFAAAELNAGKNLLTVSIPWEGPAYNQFVGIRQITSGAALSAGAINAFLTPTPGNRRTYPEYAGL